MVKVEHGRDAEDWASLRSMLASPDPANYELAKMMLPKLLLKLPLFRFIESLRKSKKHGCDVLGRVKTKHDSTLTAQLYEIKSTFNGIKTISYSIEIRNDKKKIGWIVETSDYLHNVAFLFEPSDKIGLFA